MATRQIMEMARHQVVGILNQWKIIIIIDVAINKLPGYIWTEYFKSVNLHPHDRLIFPECIKNISLLSRL